jgi:hypothetical protein
MPAPQDVAYPSMHTTGLRVFDFQMKINSAVCCPGPGFIQEYRQTIQKEKKKKM